nr:hypothetical protein [Tanacetum cinerariifolium]
LYVHPAVGYTCADTMADMNIPATDAPTEEAHAITPPTRKDDQILPSINWLYEQWFNLHKDILKDALDITPTNDNDPFVAPPSSVSSNTSTLWDTQVLSRKKNLATTSRGNKKTTHLLIPSIRYVGKDGREIFDMPILDALLTDEIKGAPYYGEYQEHVAKYQQHLDAEHGKAAERGAIESSKATKVTKPKAAKVVKPASEPKPKPTPTQPTKAAPEKKQKLVQKTPDEPSPAKRSKGGLVEEPAYNEEDANLQWALELSLKEKAERTQRPAYPVVIRKPDSGRSQPLSEVQGKGKEKVVEEQAIHDLLTLQTLKNKIHVDQFIFQRHTPMPAEAFGPDESPSLDAKLALPDSQAGPNPGVQDEGQAGSNPGDAAGSQPQSSHVVHDGPNLEPMDLEATDVSHLQNLKQLDEEFTTTAYPNFFVEKQHEEEPGKTNAEVEVQSMVSVPIHQDTSLVPPMTTLVIDLTTLQFGSPLSSSSTTTSTVMTTTIILPPPPQPQQSTTDPTLMKRIDELEQHMANLLQYNLALEESDLPAVDMKEILQQRMFKDKSYEAHEDHKKLYDALEILNLKGFEIFKILNLKGFEIFNQGREYDLNIKSDKNVIY